MQMPIGRPLQDAGRSGGGRQGRVHPIAGPSDHIPRPLPRPSPIHLRILTLPLNVAFPPPSLFPYLIMQCVV